MGPLGISEQARLPPICTCAAMAWSWNQGWQGAGAGASSSSWQGQGWQGAGAGASSSSEQGRKSARRPSSRAPYQPDRAEEEQHAQGAPGPSTGGGLSPPLPSGIGDKKQKHIGGISIGEGMWRLVQRNPSPWDSCRMVQWPSHLATIIRFNPGIQQPSQPRSPPAPPPGHPNTYPHRSQ